jgi:hypothetical protein
VYLVGHFFTQVYKVFLENNLSKQKFYLKDHFYIDKIKEIFLFVSEKKLLSIKKIIEKHENIDISIDSLNQRSEELVQENNEISKKITDSKNQKYLFISKFVLAEIETSEIFSFIPDYLYYYDQILLHLFFKNFTDLDSTNKKKIESFEKFFIELIKIIKIKKIKIKKHLSDFYFLIDILKVINKKDMGIIIKKFNVEFHVDPNLFLQYKNISKDDFIDDKVFYFLKFLDSKKLNLIKNSI